MMITDLSVIRLSLALIAILALAILTRSIFGETQFGEDGGNPDFGGMCLVTRRNFQRVLERLGDACVLPLAEPF